MFHMPPMMDMVVILALVMLLFGTSKLKNIGKDLGTAVKEFKTAFSDKPENKDDGASSAS